MFKTEKEVELMERQHMVFQEMGKCIVTVLVGFPLGILLLVVLSIFGII
ncbi:hypothetical protein BUBS_207 [Bacillus phage Bubs]|nr:hypothetical protein BI006_gp206 [Bacillus phage Nemo]AMW63722.1 hypothetical protein NEMO_206 [Bacillus phage Nemo]ASR78775.1 hypothetical protein BUBS_207 [Bacillus phage Bubs]AXQ67414.1 hypothetical protein OMNIODEOPRIMUS_204 [Bacillus phage OmnioDeoPrimus]